MSSRDMCLLPRATLHSDSEQFRSKYINFKQNFLKFKQIRYHVFQLYFYKNPEESFFNLMYIYIYT
jgi:hypothetical protein